MKRREEGNKDWPVLTIRISPAMHKALKMAAHEEAVTMAQVVRVAVKDWLSGRAR